MDAYQIINKIWIQTCQTDCDTNLRQKYGEKI